MLAKFLRTISAAHNTKKEVGMSVSEFELKTGLKAQQ